MPEPNLHLDEHINHQKNSDGCRMSRRAALNTVSRSARDAYLRERGVTLLGGGVDESPQVYKDIETVIASQADLIDVLGKFSPRIVRMADEPGDI